MEADYDDFVIVDKYYNALPRSNEYELRALGQKLIQRGQQKPIIVNSNMEILDGYTRHDLLGQRGVKIKYVFMNFTDKKSEFEFVVETNVMRRQLNTFQRVEAIHGFFLQERLDRNMLNMDSHIDILFAIKNGKNTSTTIQTETKYEIKNIRRNLKWLTDKYYISRSEKHEAYTNGRGGKTFFTYTLLPKGEERCDKIEPRLNAIDMVSKVIGVNRISIEQSSRIIQNCKDDNILVMLRESKISVANADAMIRGKLPPQKGHSKNVWGKFSKIKCNHCGHIGTKNEYTKVGTNYVQ